MKPKFNSDIKKKWLVALRSGKYSQCRGAFRKEDGFCCLGVLADVMQPDGWETNWLKRTEQGRIQHSSESFIYSGYFFEDKQTCWHLAALNDSAKKSFTEIADWVEENIQTESTVEGFFN